MRVTLIVNPVASSVNSDRRDQVAGVLGAAHDLTTIETRHRGHASELAGASSRAGADVVVVLGGDGTVNEVVNGLAECGGTASLAPLPGGSTNVYARTAGYHARLGTALDQLDAALRSPTPPRHVNLGIAGGRRFCFHAAIGYGAAVVESVDRRPAALKRRAAHALFTTAAVATWARMRDRHSPRFDLVAGNHVVAEGAAFAIVSKTSPYTFLGPRRLLVAPDASFDSPLAVTALTSLSFRSLSRAVGSALGTGRRLRTDPAAVYTPGLATVTMRAIEPVPYELDGELIATVRELELGVDDYTLPLVIPGSDRGRTAARPLS